MMESSSKPIPNIIHLEEKKLIGLSRAVSLNDNETGMLWKSFMQRRSAITNANGPELYSISVYPHLYFESFDSVVQFTKWATVAVTSYDDLPTHMDTYILQSGLYAVFNYKGSSTDNSIFRYIFSTWLPQSGYDLDDRPHFEILGEKYKNNDPHSEEMICIPVKLKKNDGRLLYVNNKTKHTGLLSD